MRLCKTPQTGYWNDETFCSIIINARTFYIIILMVQTIWFSDLHLAKFLDTWAKPFSPCIWLIHPASFDMHSCDFNGQRISHDIYLQFYLRYKHVRFFLELYIQAARVLLAVILNTFFSVYRRGGLPLCSPGESLRCITRVWIRMAQLKVHVLSRSLFRNISVRVS